MRLSAPIIAAVLLGTLSIANADGPCGSAGVVWPAEGDGSARLAYEHGGGGDRLELIHREAEGVIVARGLVADGNRFREVHAIYDLRNATLIHAIGKRTLSAAQAGSDLLSEYPMQSHFDVRAFAPVAGAREQIEKLLSGSYECRDEVLQLWQGRDYNKGKCGDTITALNETMHQLARPETSGFKETTTNAHLKRFIEGVRAERNEMVLGIFTDRNDPDGSKKAYCTGIQTMEMKLVERLRDPEIQRKLEAKKRMPAYLDQPGSYEKTTVERFRY